MDRDAGAIEGTVFRPAKRRKFIRNRGASEDDEPIPAPDHPVFPHQDAEAIAPPLAEILRLQKNKARKTGIVFSNTEARTSEPPPPPSTELIAMDAEAERLKAISDRFVGHSGQVVDVDKHMVAYIESEMAKRRLGQVVSPSSPVPHDDASKTGSQADHRPPFSTADRQTLQRQPASLGKIHEIDLGADASQRNRQRTELAMRRARGEEIPPEEPAVVKKPRLGRNGKPRRGPRRRNSEDLKRDQLVEEVLHESRLDIYDEPEAAATDQVEGVLDTDERIAEQFKQDFIDAMRARRRHRTGGQAKQQQQQAKAKPGEQVPQRGPKLGGSRSARAAMREQQEKEKKK